MDNVNDNLIIKYEYPENDLEKIYDLYKKKSFNKFNNRIPILLSRNNIITWKLIKQLYDDKYVDNSFIHTVFWFNISKHKCITWDIIKEHSYIPWNWNGFSSNVNLSWDIIQNNKSLQWNWISICLNKNINWENILEIIESGKVKCPFIWKKLSLRKDFPFEYILSNVDKYWDWNVLSRSKTLNFQNVLNNLQLPWDWDLLSCNSNVSWNDIINNLHLPWSWTYISFNCNITYKVLVEYINDINIPWDYDSLSFNPNLTLDIILSCNETNKWYWKAITGHKNINWNDIMKHIELPWDYNMIHLNPNITIDIIYKYPYVQWNWDHLSEIIDIDDILNDTIYEKNWNWGIISLKNKSITYKHVINNSNKNWSFNNLFSNTFKYKSYIKQWELRDHAARIIQRGCANWIDKPVTSDGKYGISLRLLLQKTNKIN